VTRNANTVTCHSLPDQRDHRASARERMGARQRHVRGQVLDGSNRYREAGVEPTFAANVGLSASLPGHPKSAREPRTCSTGDPERNPVRIRYTCALCALRTRR
jgi:hypothetical protein